MKPALATYTNSIDNDKSKFKFWLYRISKEGSYDSQGGRWRWQEGELEKMEIQFIHIPMRQNWTEELPQFIFSSNDTKIRLLAIAGYFGHIQLVQSLVASLPHNDKLISALEFAFEGSCCNNHENMVDYLLSVELDQGTNSAMVDEYMEEKPKLNRKWTPYNQSDYLTNAIYKGQTNAVRLHLKVLETRFTDLSFPDSVRLACWCSGDNLDIVKMLLGYGGVDIHFPISNHSRIVDRVLGRFPNFNQYQLYSGYHNYSAIENAAAYGNLVILKYFLRVNQLDPRTTLVNNYLLLEAAGRGHADMVRYLLTNTNLDPTFENSITLVVACGYAKVVQVLLEDGRVNPCCQENKPFFRAAIECLNVDVARLLLDTGKVNLRVNDINYVWNRITIGNTKVLFEMLKMFLERCPSLVVDVTDRFNYIFEDAALHGELEILKELLTLGVDPAVNDNAAIREAVRRGQTETVRFLVGLDGVDAAARNNEAIKMAAERGDLDIVRILVGIEGVSDPLANDGEAVRLAAARYPPEIVELLTTCSSR
ncbi:hypothetical protein HDU76_004982 [Blyttiomyces sp. JEL0837]|nr:hypothetical protein HDU76_004982 [Blyttiomyces sp. JEL0837]